MSFLFIVSQVLLYSILLGLFLWGAKHSISLYVFSRKKEEINKLNARISILKLHLKGKIKRKCNKITEVFKKDQDSETLYMLQPKLNAIAVLEFSIPADYQTLINSLNWITQNIIDHIRIKHKTLIKLQEAQAIAEAKTASTASEDDKIKENCKKLVKYDKAHMLIVVEIIQATDQVIEKINEYNALTEFEKKQKKITNIPQKIQIEHYAIIAELVEQAKNSNIDAPDFQVLGKELLKEAV